MVLYEFHNGGKPVKKEIPAAEMDKAMALHNALVEAAAENEEGLMEKFLNPAPLQKKNCQKV